MKESASWPKFSKDEIQAVNNVLESGQVNYWTGKEGRLFEKEYAQFVGVPYAVAMMNGTVTLQAALKALDIQPGDEVIVPSHTFVATASAVVACGATPVCADVDLSSNNITVDTIKEVFSCKTKVIILVHLAGLPCDMDPILQFSKQHQLKVIEDCAQAHGATYKDRAVGSMGDIGSFSFCQDKIISTGGEGGMVVTKSEELFKRMWAYKDHGKSYEAVYNREHPRGFRWLVESFGTNLRMTEMQAAIGRIQLAKLPDWVAARNEHAAILTSQLELLSIMRLLDVPADRHHAYYKFYAYVNLQFLSADWSRDRIIEEIKQQGFPCYQGGCTEIYREKAFESAAMAPQERCHNARLLGETSLQFLVDPSFDQNQMQKYASVIRDTLLKASISS